MTTLVEIDSERLGKLLADRDSVDDVEVAVDEAIELWLELENPREMIE